MKHSFLLLIFSIVAVRCIPAPASDAHRLEAAGQSYEAKKYQEAIDIWKGVAATSPDAGLYYNIGMAYAHLGQTAEAVYAFEQGLRLKPLDDRLTKQRMAERKNIPDAVIPIEPFFLSRWYHGYLMLFRPGTWAFLGLIAILLFVLHHMAIRGLLPVKVMVRGAAPWLVALAGGIMLLTAAVSYRQLARKDESIVMQPCALRQAPAEESPSVRLLSPGEKIVVRDAIGDWQHVILVNLDDGWIKKECGRVIYLPRP